MHTTLSASKQWAQRNQTAAFLLKTVIGANVVALLRNWRFRSLGA